MDLEVDLEGLAVAVALVVLEEGLAIAAQSRQRRRIRQVLFRLLRTGGSRLRQSLVSLGLCGLWLWLFDWVWK